MCFVKRISLGFVLFLMFTTALLAQSPGSAGSDAVKTHAHSRAGIEEQFADVVAVVRTGDEDAIHKALNTLGIPDAKGWVTANFAEKDVAQEYTAYAEGLKKFQSHVWWENQSNRGLTHHPIFAPRLTASNLPAMVKSYCAPNFLYWGYGLLWREQIPTWASPNWSFAALASTTSRILTLRFRAIP
jgi:hypothetical protein